MTSVRQGEHARFGSGFQSSKGFLGRPGTGYLSNGFPSAQSNNVEFLSQSELPIDIKLATARKNLETKSSISAWTKHENSAVDKAIETISGFERKI